LRLSHLRLQNFRCFENLTLELDPRLTVLVAENGRGKTTLLDAIRIMVWPFVGAFDLARSGYTDPHNSIAMDDVRLVKLRSGDMSRQLPAELELGFNLDGQRELVCQRYRTSEAKATKTKDAGDTPTLKAHTRTLQELIRQPDAPPQVLPLFGYYGTGRLWSEKRLLEAVRRKDDSREIDFYVRTFAYQNCLDPASTYKHFREWYTWAFESFREAQIRELEGAAPGLDLTAARDRVRVVQVAIDAVLREATGWHSLEYSVSNEKSLVLRHETQGVLKVDQLSDGIRSVLAMVGDIAHRCIKLNPHLGLAAASQTSGVVMIDEVDMHLHPRWQQLILGQLAEAFPAIQFIVTTHSPQVLTTVPAACIRVLTEDLATGQIGLSGVSNETEGVASSDVLAQVMHVSPIPAVPAAQAVQAYRALIDQDLAETPGAQELRTTLVAHFGADHPVILESDRMIRLQALRHKLPKRRPGEP
jgi:predicted ATP-binding protein involved in virulence